MDNAATVTTHTFEPRCTKQAELVGMPAFLQTRGSFPKIPILAKSTKLHLKVTYRLIELNVQCDKGTISVLIQWAITEFGHRVVKGKRVVPSRRSQPREISTPATLAKSTSTSELTPKDQTVTDISMVVKIINVSTGGDLGWDLRRDLSLQLGLSPHTFSFIVHMSSTQVKKCDGKEAKSSNECISQLDGADTTDSEEEESQVFQSFSYRRDNEREEHDNYGALMQAARSLEPTRQLYRSSALTDPSTQDADDVALQAALEASLQDQRRLERKRQREAPTQPVTNTAPDQLDMLTERVMTIQQRRRRRELMESCSSSSQPSSNRRPIASKLESHGQARCHEGRDESATNASCTFPFEPHIQLQVLTESKKGTEVQAEEQPEVVVIDEAPMPHEPRSQLLDDEADLPDEPLVSYESVTSSGSAVLAEDDDGIADEPDYEDRNDLRNMTTDRTALRRAMEDVLVGHPRKRRRTLWGEQRHITDEVVSH